MIGWALKRPGSMVVFLLFAFLIYGPVAQKNIKHTDAGALTNVSITTSDVTKSATNATYTVTFTTATKIPASTGRINFHVNGPYWDYSFSNASLGETTSPSSLSIYYRNYNGLTLYTTSDIAANTTVSIKVAGVTNPSKGGYYFAHIWTSDYSTALDGTDSWGGDYNTPYFEIGTNNNVTGTITDSNGSPVAFTNVYIYSGNWSNYYYTYTDGNGVYGFADVVAGSYTFNMYGPYNTSGKSYFAPSTSTITVGSSGVTTKNAAFLAATKTISGTITKNSATGAAVTDANIYVYKNGGNGWASATTDSSGNYSFSVTGGTWSISVNPSTWPSTWTYSNDYSTVSFAEDSTTQSTSKNFIVDVLSSTISGIIAKPNSITVNQYDVGISLVNAKNQWFSAQLSSSGNSDGSRNFSAQVTPGTYTVSGWMSDSTYSFPKVDNFSVSDNETKDLGTISLTEKTDQIAVTVLDNTGAGVGNAYVSAWRNDGTYDWGNCQSASDGTCTIKVTPGTWQISAWPQWKEGGYDQISDGKPKTVTVTSGTTATTSFTFQKVTATINGTVTDPDGNVISSLSSWVSANDGSGSWNNIGASVTNGTFTLKVPAGTWDVNVYIWGGDYGTADPQQVTVADNETKSISVQTTRNNATISGTVYDDTDTAITNKWMSIYATKGKYGAWQSASFDQTTGAYSIKVSAGTWNLGWWIDQNLGYSSGDGQDVKVEIADSETKTYDIHLKRADSTISGKAKKSDGTNMQWAWVTADSRDPNEKKETSAYYYSNGASSNASGDYTMKIPAGTYWIGANMWSGSGYINPVRQKVTVDANTPATVDLTFRIADATISGTVTKEGSGVNAYVTSWSEDGGYAEANANNQGTYSLSVSSGTKWHVSSVIEVEKDIWKSVEKVVDLTNSTTASQDLELLKRNFSMPNSVSTTFDPSKQNTMTLDDGTTLNMPAGSISNSATSVTVSADPTASLAEEDDAKPLSYGYEMTATDQNGVDISQFASMVTLETPYTDTMLDDSSISDEDELNVGYYDDASGTWKELSNCTVNEDANTITCQIDHFTKFAILSASDTSPPSSPTSITATAGDTTASLAWVNPTESDFATITIYRSTILGTLGDAVKTGETGTTATDTRLTNGTTYYYTVKAVDRSGNASSDATQVSVTPTAATSTAASTSSTTATAAATTETVAASTLPKTERDAEEPLPFAGMSIIAVLAVSSIYFLRRLHA